MNMSKRIISREREKHIMLTNLLIMGLHVYVTDFSVITLLNPFIQNQNTIQKSTHNE